VKSLFVLLTATMLLSALVTATAETSGATERLPSGVVVQHLVQGAGARPTEKDVVRVNYRGTLSSGAEFDNSAKHDGPVTLSLGRAIPCWVQGLKTMKVGGKAKLTCPAATAYGERSIGAIPRGSELTFEVELVGIEK